jgi:N-methylhydantoinase B/oxoprolinase/acetone carboxylase alpha subunit
MPELRTRSAGAKVTDKEYAEIEKLAQARGLNVGEWCREVILEAVSEAEADALTVETLLAEIAALRMIFLNVTHYAAQRPGELTTEKMQELIDRADREKFHRVAEMVDAQAARKKPAKEKPSGDGQR